jgi:hypothetical protein
MCWEKEECENFENALGIFSEAIEALNPLAAGILLSLQTAIIDLRDERSVLALPRSLLSPLTSLLSLE